MAAFNFTLLNQGNEDTDVSWSKHLLHTSGLATRIDITFVCRHTSYCRVDKHLAKLSSSSALRMGKTQHHGDLISESPNTRFQICYPGARRIIQNQRWHTQGQNSHVSLQIFERRISTHVFLNQKEPITDSDWRTWFWPGIRLIPSLYKDVSFGSWPGKHCQNTTYREILGNFRMCLTVLARSLRSILSRECSVRWNRETCPWNRTCWFRAEAPTVDGRKAPLVYTHANISE